MIRRKQQRSISEWEGDELKAWVDKVADNLKKNNKFESEIPEDIITSAYTNTLNIFLDTLIEEISRAFASDLKDLKLFNSESFSFVIKFNGFSIQIKYSGDKLNINLKQLLEEIKKEIQKSKISLKIMVDELHGPVMSFQSQDSSGDIKIRADRLLIDIIDSVPNDVLVRNIQDAVEDAAARSITQQHLKQMMKKCYYLPAARSGIMQGQSRICCSNL